TASGTRRARRSLLDGAPARERRTRDAPRRFRAARTDLGEPRAGGRSAMGRVTVDSRRARFGRGGRRTGLDRKRCRGGGTLALLAARRARRSATRLWRTHSALARLAAASARALDTAARHRLSPPDRAGDRRAL